MLVLYIATDSYGYAGSLPYCNERAILVSGSIDVQTLVYYVPVAIILIFDTLYLFPVAMKLLTLWATLLCRRTGAARVAPRKTDDRRLSLQLSDTTKTDQSNFNSSKSKPPQAAPTAGSKEPLKDIEAASKAQNTSTVNGEPSLSDSSMAGKVILHKNVIASNTLL
jgi:hypothetical protein